MEDVNTTVVGIFLAVLVAGVTAAAVVSFSSVGLPERLGEVAAIVVAILVLAWVWAGGLESTIQAYRERVRHQLIIEHRELIPQLNSYARNARLLFTDTTGNIGSISAVTSQLEGCLFGSQAQNATPPVTTDEQRSGQFAQTLRMGWRMAWPAREQAFAEVERLCQKRALEDTDDFISAFRLVRGYLQTDFDMLADYQRLMKQAHPGRFQSQLIDDWDGFRTRANSLAAEWVRWATSVGGTIGIEGPYALPFIGGLG